MSASQVYLVDKSKGEQRRAHVLQRENDRYYVHYLDEDKRMDEWVSQDKCVPASSSSTLPPSKKRKRGGVSSKPPGVELTADSSSSLSNSANRLVESLPNRPPVADKRSQSKQKNFDEVFFGQWKIKTWYFSPYPLTDIDIDDVPPQSALARSRVQGGTARTATHRNHGRTADVQGTNRYNVSEPPNLWVCDQCFKYFSESVVWEVHQKRCNTAPPGRKVYVRDPLSIWEIDGAVAKLYCQNLSLFGKLFIDIKTLFFDLDNFMFYVLTTSTPLRDSVIGYFSKEKVSFDDYNLACIVTFPQHQRQSFGMLMIEFSYELSRRANKVGTPERPLSDLGLRGYLAYWVATIIRFLRRVLTTLPPMTKGIIVGTNNFPDINTLEREVVSRKRQNDNDLQAEILTTQSPLDFLDEPMFTTERQYVTKLREDGGAETHVHVTCTVEDIARATNLRVEDAAFALNECGLLIKRFSETSQTDPGAIVITRPMIEAVAKARDIKRMVLDLKCVLL